MKQYAKIMREAISSVDVYGQRVNLLIKRQESFSTVIGVLSSLIVAGITLFSFISLTQQMLSRQNPNIVSKVVSNIYPEAYYFSPENFYLAFGLADPQALPILNTPEEVYYTFELKFCHQYVIKQGDIYVPKVNCSYIDMVNCLQAGTYPNLTEGIAKERLAFGLCPNTTTWRTVLDQTYIEGISTGSDFRYMSGSVIPCDKTAQNSKIQLKFKDCVSDEKAARLRYGFVQMAFTDRLLDQSQPGNPYSLVSKTDFFRFSNATSTDISYIYRHSYFQDETNFYYYFPNQETYHVVSLQSGTVSNIISQDIVHFSFLLDAKTEVYYRTYNTFFDIFGNVGGIQQFLTFVFSLLAIPITKQAQQMSLLNSIFQFEESGNDKNKSSIIFERRKSVNSIYIDQKMHSMSPTKLSKVETLSRTTFDNTQEPLKKFLNKKHKMLKLRLYEYITIGCCGKKGQLIKKGKEKIEKQLDITLIINKLIELEKLKRFLLNENQLKLFEYIPKPIIRYGVKNSIFPIKSSTPTDYFTGDTKFDRKLGEALASYRKLKNSNLLDDQKLIRMMDFEVKELFDQMLPDYLASLRQTDMRGDSLPRDTHIQMQQILDDIEDLNPGGYSMNKFSKIISAERTVDYNN